MYWEAITVIPSDVCWKKNTSDKPPMYLILAKYQDPLHARPCLCHGKRQLLQASDIVVRQVFLSISGICLKNNAGKNLSHFLEITIIQTTRYIF